MPLHVKLRPGQRLTVNGGEIHNEGRGNAHLRIIAHDVEIETTRQFRERMSTASTEAMRAALEDVADPHYAARNPAGDDI